MNVSSDPQDDPEELDSRRDESEAEHAERRDDPDDRDQHEADDRQAGRELAVDHVVAVDRLGQQARQRSLGPLAVDGVEGERQPEERRDVARGIPRPPGA